MSQRPPVKDWATDFDHLDQRWINDPFPIWDDIPGCSTRTGHPAPFPV